jgi:fructose-1,6-bisphosphatase I
MGNVDLPTSPVTIERFIMEQERLFPEATGDLSNLLYDICLAAKIISHEVRRAGLNEILGAFGTRNTQGEAQQKLDVFANETVRNAVQHTGRVCVTASEEDDGPMPVPDGRKLGKYVLLFDPLDGSSNIDVNVPVGTIFSIYRRLSTGNGPGTLADCLQPGRKQIAAGFVLYGSSTMLVYTTGRGVHGFTLDPTIGEFLLSHPQIKLPNTSKFYAINESNEHAWSPAVRQVIQAYKKGTDTMKAKNMRWVASLVADIYRNMIAGGVFLYPGDSKSPKGKLRLTYECAPMAFVMEQAGGWATDGRTPILDIAPESLHQKTPLVIGNREDVEFATKLMSAELTNGTGAGAGAGAGASAATRAGMTAAGSD